MASKQVRALMVCSSAGLAVLAALTIPDVRAYRKLCEVTRELRPDVIAALT